MAASFLCDFDFHVQKAGMSSMDRRMQGIEPAKIRDSASAALCPGKMRTQ